MSIMRYDPLREVAAVQGEMRRLLDAMFTGLGNTPARSEDRDGSWLPAVDVQETDGEIVLSFDLPGLREDEIEIQVQDNVLTVTGQREQKQEETRDGYRHIERRFGRFSRSFPLPPGVEEDRIKARYENGELEIRIPKPAERQARRVSIGEAGEKQQK